MAAGTTLDLEAFRAVLATRAIGRELHYHERVGSTSDLALAAAEAGAAHGLMVFAEQQTRGRGRSGSSWIAPARSSLLFSLVVRDSLAAGALPVVTLAVGVALARTVREVGVSRAELKWPNDVLVGERKLAGVLCESRGRGSSTGALVVGIGLNLWQGGDELPPGATSLALEGWSGGSREGLLATILVALERELDRLAAGRASAVLDDWRALAPGHRGRRLEVSDGDRRWQGVSEGLDADGALLARRDSGERVRVVSGSVRFLAPATSGSQSS